MARAGYKPHLRQRAGLWVRPLLNPLTGVRRDPLLTETERPGYEELVR